MALDAVCGDGDDLAVLDLAHEFGADDVERAGLGRQHVRGAKLAQHQRPDADGIACADQHVVGQADERIGAFDLQQRIDEALDDAPALGAGDEVQDDLGIGGRLADGAGGDEVAPQRESVGEVAVVGDGEAAGVEIGEQRLHVAQDGVAGRRVAIVPEGDMALEPADHVGLVEIVADQAEAALGMEMGAIEGDDAGGLLAAVLQGVQAERGQGRGVLVSEHAEDTALLAQAIVLVMAPKRPESAPLPVGTFMQASRKARFSTRLRHCAQVPGCAEPPAYRPSCMRLAMGCGDGVVVNIG